MTTAHAPEQLRTLTKARRTLRFAWLSMSLLPVSFVAAMVLGDWLLTEQGYETGAGDVAVGAALKAGVPAVLVLISPTLLMLWLGLRAKRYGHPQWMAPVAVAVTIAAACVGLNLVQVVVALLGG